MGNKTGDKILFNDWRTGAGLLGSGETLRDAYGLLLLSGADSRGIMLIKGISIYRGWIYVKEAWIARLGSQTSFTYLFTSKRARGGKGETYFIFNSMGN